MLGGCFVYVLFCILMNFCVVLVDDIIINGLVFMCRYIIGLNFFDICYSVWCGSFLNWCRFLIRGSGFGLGGNLEFLFCSLVMNVISVVIVVIIIVIDYYDFEVLFYFFVKNFMIFFV